MLDDAKARCAECWRRLPVRAQLAVSYGCSSGALFIFLVAASAASAYKFRDVVIEQSRDALAAQVHTNTLLLAKEASETFKAELDVGIKAFVLPTVFSIMEANRHDRAYSLAPYLSSHPHYPFPDIGSNDPATMRLATAQPLPADSAQRYVRDQRSGNLWLSTNASSVFVQFFPAWDANQLSTINTEVDRLVSGRRAEIDAYSHADAYIRAVWPSEPAWVQQFVGFQKQSGEGGLSKRFPGSMGDNCAPPKGIFAHNNTPMFCSPQTNEVRWDGDTLAEVQPVYQDRTYDPAVRGWYKGAIKYPFRDPEQRTPMFYSEPYIDASGKGFLLSLASPIFTDRGVLKGAALVDLLVKDVQKFITKLQSRQTGEAHLFHTETGLVVASRQWNPDIPIESGKRLPNVSTIYDIPIITGATARITRDKINAASGVYTEGDYEVAWQQLPLPRSNEGLNIEGLNKEHSSYIHSNIYTVVIVTPLEEIYASIESQRKTIEDEADSLFISSLVLCAIGMAVVVTSVFALSCLLANPLIAISEEASGMVASIGAENFGEGSGAGGLCSTGVGEVKELRQHFLNLVSELLRKRELKRNAPPPPRNPMYGRGADVGSPPVPAGLEGLQLPQPVEVADDRGAAADRADSVRAGIPIFVYIVLMLIVPVIALTGVVIGMTGSSMQKKGDEWIDPVRKVIIVEENTTLRLRAYERAEMVGRVMASQINTLKMVASFYDQLIDGTLQPHPDPARSTYPALYAVPGDSTVCGDPLFTCTRPHDYRSNGSPRRNTDGSQLTGSWYRPDRPHPDNKASSDNNVFFDNSALYNMTASLSHLDSAMRVAYFSNIIDLVQFGFEEQEIFWQFPYEDMSQRREATFDCREASYGRYRNTAGNNVKGYTPICRRWFEDSRLYGAPGEVFFHGADINQVGTLYVMLSMPLRLPAAPAGPGLPFSHTGRETFGVVAVDAGLGLLMDAVLGMNPIYSSGHAYLIDMNGTALVHKGMMQEDCGGKPPPCSLSAIAVLESNRGEDAAAYSSYEREVLPLLLAAPASGEASLFEWAPPGGDARFIAYARASGTPYTLVLSVPLSDVSERADKVVDDVKKEVSKHYAATIIVSAIVCSLLVLLTSMQNVRFAKPVKELSTTMSAWGQNGYASDVPAGAHPPTSRELIGIFEDMKKLLQALRFDNADYHKGDQRRQMTNYMEVRNLAKNKRGVGVVLSGMGRLASKMKDAPISAVETLRAAVQNAEERIQMAEAGGSADPREPSLGGGAKVTPSAKGAGLRELRAARAMREWYLAIALARRDQNAGQDAEEARKLAVKAVEEHKHAADWKALCTRAYEAKGDAPQLLPHVLPAAVETLKGAALNSPGDGTSVAFLCAALAAEQKDDAPVRWALTSVGNLPTPLLAGLAAPLRNAPGCAAAQGVLDHVASSIPARQKRVIFCIDRTWQPILPIAISSVRSLVDGQLSGRDVDCGLYGLGDGWIKQSKLAAADVSGAEKLSGACILYTSMIACLDALGRADVSAMKWLVVLTDLVDLESKDDSQRMGMLKQRLSSMNDLNVAIIDSSAISGWEPENPRWPAFRQNITDIIDTLHAAGNGGYHLKAGDAEEVGRKFAEVGQLMMDVGGEAL